MKCTVAHHTSAPQRRGASVPVSHGPMRVHIVYQNRGAHDQTASVHLVSGRGGRRPWLRKLRGPAAGSKRPRAAPSRRLRAKRGWLPGTWYGKASLIFWLSWQSGLGNWPRLQSRLSFHNGNVLPPANVASVSRSCAWTVHLHRLRCNGRCWCTRHRPHGCRRKITSHEGGCGWVNRCATCRYARLQRASQSESDSFTMLVEHKGLVSVRGDKHCNAALLRAL